MRKKRLISIFLVLVLIISIFTACNSKEGPSKEEDPPTAGEDVKPKDDGKEEEKEDELVAEDVLLKTAENLMKNLPDDNHMIDPEEALEQFEENPQAMVWVDMRSAEDYEKGHVEGAINIPYADLGKNLDRIARNKLVILQCYSGQTSAQAVAMFKMAGFNALSYRGGLKVDEVELVTEASELPDSNPPELDDKEKIIWEALKKYFSADTNYIVQAQELSEIVEENPDAVMVLDIRGEDDFAEGHIEGAVNIPFKEVGGKFSELPDNKAIYVVCYSGQTAGITIGALRLAGYNALSLAKGMGSWNEEGLPKVTE